MAQTKAEPTASRRQWAGRISKAQKEYENFHQSGNRVVDQYRIEQKSSVQQEKYNILYSITETIKPSMYSQTPKPEVQRRHKDRTNPVVIAATLLLEQGITYTIDDQDFDDIMNSCVEDFLLPGLGVAWCRYEPTISKVPAVDVTNDNQPLTDAKGNPVYNESIDYEKVAVDYVHWKDFLTGKAAKWEKVPWIAKRVYLDKDEFKKKFPKVPISKVRFGKSENGPANDNVDLPEATTPVWEIWDKRSRTVIWYCEFYEDDLLKVEPDFLKLKDFFPCPRPLRAVTTNNKFVPRPFYSQYQAQADELNDITGRIRKLARALKAVGVYDQSVPQLQNLLSGGDNRMIPVDNWPTMADKGGIKGTVDFLPIAEVANVLMQLYDARERIKGEIYEITGWSDIIRGVSKASETLGAQQLKADWAGARLKLLQKDVERFVRDIFRIIGEVISEHYNKPMLLNIAGFDPDTMQQDPDAMKLMGVFDKTVDILKNEKDRCALIGVETDSTLLPDESKDKAERMEFVGAVGAFLQQAVPAMQTTPALAPVLGEILMFSVRGFRGARSLETTFKSFTDQMAAQPPQQPGQEQKGDGGAGAQASAQAKMADTQAKTGIAQAELQEEQRQHSVDTQLERDKEANRHRERMMELDIRNREALIKERELGMAQTQQGLDNLNTSIEREIGENARQEDRQDRAADRQAAQSRPRQG